LGPTATQTYSYSNRLDLASYSFPLGDALKGALLGNDPTRMVNMLQRIALKKANAVKVADEPAPKEVTDFLDGFMNGLGASVADECYKSSEDMEAKVAAFIKDIVNKDSPKDIIDGIHDLVDALLKDLPDAKTSCQSTIDDLKALKAKLDQYKTASDLVRHGNEKIPVNFMKLNTTIRMIFFAKVDSFQSLGCMYDAGP